MTALESLIDRTLADPLAAARAAPGGIGYVGTDIPLDLLLGSGRHVCHLPWCTDRATPIADQWLESGFHDWARSMIEDWAAGRFDCFTEVVFSRGDDSAHRLYYYVCELQRRGMLAGPRPLVFDVARIPRATSLRHCARSIRALAQSLAIDDAALCTGIAHANRLRERFAALDADRVARGSVYERIARASLFADLSPVLDAALPKETFTGRVLLAGSAPPDERLHLAVEQYGWTVSGETHGRSLARLGPVIADFRPDPVTALAMQVHGATTGTRNFIDPVAALVGAVRRARADAVILWLVEQEEALVWHVPAQRAALAAAGIPALILTRQRWDAGDGAADAIANFLRSLAR